MDRKETFEALVARVNSSSFIAPLESAPAGQSRRSKETEDMKTLSTFAFPTKKIGAATAKYDWDTILSGQPVLLAAGKDCEDLKLMGHMAYSQARRREMTVQIVGLDDKGLKTANQGKQPEPCKMSNAVAIVVQATAADADQIAKWAVADEQKKTARAAKKAKMKTEETAPATESEAPAA